MVLRAARRPMRHVHDIDIGVAMRGVAPGRVELDRAAAQLHGRDEQVACRGQHHQRAGLVDRHALAEQLDAGLQQPFAIEQIGQVRPARVDIIHACVIDEHRREFPVFQRPSDHVRQREAARGASFVDARAQAAEMGNGDRLVAHQHGDVAAGLPRAAAHHENRFEDRIGVVHAGIENAQLRHERACRMEHGRIVADQQHFARIHAEIGSDLAHGASVKREVEARQHQFVPEVGRCQPCPRLHPVGVGADRRSDAIVVKGANHGGARSDERALLAMFGRAAEKRALQAPDDESDVHGATPMSSPNASYIETENG